MGIDSTQYGLIGSLLRRLDAANALALLSLFSLLNSLLAVLRVLWFAVFTTCSWYAVMVAFMFIHMHLGKGSKCVVFWSCACAALFSKRKV